MKRRPGAHNPGAFSVALALLLWVQGASAQTSPDDADAGAPQPTADAEEDAGQTSGETSSPADARESDSAEEIAPEAEKQQKPLEPLADAAGGGGAVSREGGQSGDATAVRQKATVATVEPAQQQVFSTVQGGEGDVSEGLDDVSLVDLLKLDLRVATTKTNTTVQASPASVTVISREQIERYGYRSVAEALRDVVGTYAVDDHITPNLGMRGIPGAAFEGSGAVKVMIDGVPVSFRTTGENWLGPSLIPLSSVERIEIVKGPTSSLYGADAFLGVINIITRQPRHRHWGEVGGGGTMTYSGNPGGYAEVSAGLVMRPWRLTLGAQFEQEDRSGLNVPSTSPASSLADTASDTSRAQMLRSGVGAFKLSYTPTRKTSVSVSGRYARQQSAAEFAPWMQFTNVPGDDRRGTWISLEQGSATLRASSALSREFQLEATATGFFGGTLPDDRIDTGDGLAVVNRDLSYHGGEGMLEAVWQPTDPLRLVLGVEGSADGEHLGAPNYRDRQTGNSLPSAGTAGDYETTLVNVAGRAQVTWELIEDYLVPTGGLRIDNNTVYGEKLSGRGALVSNIFDEMYLKAAYGNAFKAPTPLLLYGRPLTIGDVIGSPELGAQQLRSLELTADYRPKDLLDLEMTISRWQLLDRAVFRPEQINLIARNAADAEGWTLESQVTSRVSEYVGGSLGFEWIAAERESGEAGYRGELFGTASAIYPDWITRARVWGIPNPLPLELWAATNVVGPRNASDSNTLEAGERYSLPTYATLDVGVRTLDLHLLNDGVTEFSLRGQNVIDSAGTAAGFFGIDYPAAPPKITLELRQEL